MSEHPGRTQENIDRIAVAAKELSENWMQGNFAQALYVDNLMQCLVDAELLPSLPVQTIPEEERDRCQS